MKKIIFMFESSVLWRNTTFIEEESKIRAYHSNETPPKLAELDADTKYINIYSKIVKELKSLDAYTDIVKDTLEIIDNHLISHISNVTHLHEPYYDETHIVELLISSILQDLTRIVAFSYVINNTPANVVKYCIMNGDYIDIIYDRQIVEDSRDFPEGFKLSNEIQSVLYRLMNRNEVSVNLRDKYYLRLISDTSDCISGFFEYPISDNWE